MHQGAAGTALCKAVLLHSSTTSQAPRKEREDGGFHPLQQFDKALSLNHKAVPACRLRLGNFQSWHA